MSVRAILPNLDTLDSAALKALILSQHEQLISRDAEIEQLKLLIAKLRRMQFGRKSEKLERQIEQLELRLDELEASRAENTTAQTQQPLPPRPPIAQRGQHGGRCPRICRAKHVSSCRSRMRVRSAAASSSHWAKMFRSCSNTCRRIGK